MPSQPSAPCQGRSNAGRTASQLARQISDPLFCDRPSCDPGGDRSNHPHSCNDDSGPGQNARPSIAFDCNCGFSLFFEEPRYSITNVLGWKQVGIMLKDQPKLWWPDRFEKATEVLTFLSHAYTPGAQFGVILAGVAGSRRRHHPLGPRGVERRATSCKWRALQGLRPKGRCTAAPFFLLLIRHRSEQKGRLCKGTSCEGHATPQSDARPRLCYGRSKRGWLNVARSRK